MYYKHWTQLSYQSLCTQATYSLFQETSSFPTLVRSSYRDKVQLKGNRLKETAKIIARESPRSGNRGKRGASRQRKARISGLYRWRLSSAPDVNHSTQSEADGWKNSVPTLHLSRNQISFFKFPCKNSKRAFIEIYINLRFGLRITESSSSTISRRSICMLITAKELRNKSIRSTRQCQ